MLQRSSGGFGDEEIVGVSIVEPTTPRGGTVWSPTALAISGSDNSAAFLTLGVRVRCESWGRDGEHLGNRQPVGQPVVDEDTARQPCGR